MRMATRAAEPSLYLQLCDQEIQRHQRCEGCEEEVGQEASAEIPVASDKQRSGHGWDVHGSNYPAFDGLI